MGKADFFRVKKASNEQIEELITVNLILDTKFATRIEPKIDLDYISSDHLKIITRWSLDYLRKYGVSPKQQIAEVFEVESSNLKSDMREQVEAVLENLSDRYTEKTNNTEFVYNEAVNYFDRQALLIRARNTISLVEKGLLDKARNEIRAYNEIRSTVVDDGVFIKSECFYEAFNEDFVTGAFRLPGAIGRMIGEFQKGWLVAFLAPMKRGKTFHLIDWAIEAYLQGMKVVFFSLEMTKKDIDKRLFCSLAGKPAEKGKVLIPVFDCKNNQDNNCGRAERTCSVGLFDEEGNRPFIEEAPKDYTPCSVCRDKAETKKLYSPDTWFITEESDGINWNDISPKRGASLYNPKNFRRFCPLTGKATYGYIEDVLNDLKLTDGFVPDVVVIDYADLLASTLNAELRHKLNEIWQGLARMAVERNVIVLTASQSNRPGISAKTLSEEAVAEDIRKNAHVSALIGINQDKKLREKEKGLIRLNMLYHRYKEVSEVECLVTHNLSIARVCLDSILVLPTDDKYTYIGG